MTHVLHALTDATASRWDKFVVIDRWLAPRLADVYDNADTQASSSGGDFQVAQRLLLDALPSSRATAAIAVLTDASGLTDGDRIRAQQVSDWLISSQKPQSAGGWSRSSLCRRPPRSSSPLTAGR